MEEVKTDIKDMNLRALSQEGYIRFSIRADDTEENQKVHDSFKEYCKLETNNDYTQGIRKLLEYYQSDFKYEILAQGINELRLTLAELKESVIEMKKIDTPKVKKDEEAF